MIIIILTSAAFLCLWYLACITFLRRGLARVGAPGAPGGYHFSVVIAARNEERTIGRCLESVLAQTVAPERFEIIVVDDRSTDRTADIVRKFSERDSRVRLVQVEHPAPGISPKKNAVLHGIACAKNEIIACTDADCRVPRAWLDTLDRYIGPDTGFVQGMVAYAAPESRKTFLYVFQSLDFLSHGVVAAGAIGAGLPLNGNANNMAFRRDVFGELGGYGDSGRVLLGDDDLLMQRVWRTGRWNVRFAADARGIVETIAAPNVSEMLRQRSRWGSVSVHYGARQVALLLGFFLFYLGAAVSLIAGPFAPHLFIAGAIMLCVKFIGELVMMMPGTLLYRRPSLLAALPLVSVLHLPMVLYAAITGVFGRHEWKETVARGKM